MRRSPRRGRRRSDSSGSSDSEYHRRRRRRNRERRRRDSRSRSRERRPRSRSRDRDRDFERRNTRLGEPTKSIIVRGLPPHITESEIAAEITDYQPVGIRIIRDRDFGFIEFASIQESESFMRNNVDVMKIQGIPVSIDFSYGARRDDGRTGGTGTRLDWLCGHCGGHNFARRSVCFQCGRPKDDTATILRDSYQQAEAKEEPNPVLVIRGLSMETTESTIRTHFEQLASLVDIRVMRDKATGGGSRGFAFVQFATTEDAAVALNRSKGMIIDGRQVRVAFSRDQGKAARAAWQDPKMWERPANLSESFKFDSKSGKYYDRNSGFYYDPVSCLYYHGESGIYYRWDVLNNKYIQVDERGVAISQETPEEKKQKEAEAKKVEEEKQAKKAVKKKKEVKKKKGLGSIAFSFRKSMKPKGGLKAKMKANTLRKAFTKAKPVAQEEPEKDVHQMAAEAARAAAQASAALAALKPTDTSSTPSAKTPALPWANLAPAKSKIPDDLQAQEAHLKPEKKICLLCKRKFGTPEKLFQHARISALHRKNLQLLEIKRIADQDRIARSKPPPRRAGRDDRRRGKSSKSKKEEPEAPSAFEKMVSKAAASVKKPIADSNKGSRMLKAMGWKKGEGLGKGARGITAPVSAEIHTRGAGLGSAPSGRNAILPGDNYQNAGIKIARARFERASGKGYGMGQNRSERPGSARNAYLAAMSEYQNTMCSEKDEHARAMLK